MADYYLLSGRLFIAFMFVLSGANKLIFFSHGLDEVRSRKLPFPRLVLSLTILVQLTCGLAIVAEGTTLAGVLTAGDLSRLAERGPGFLELRLEEVMTRTPLTAAPDELGAAAVGRMEQRGVMALPVVDEAGQVVGVVHLHDLMRAGAV